MHTVVCGLTGRPAALKIGRRRSFILIVSFRILFDQSVKATQRKYNNTQVYLCVFGGGGGGRRLLVRC